MNEDMAEDVLKSQTGDKEAFTRLIKLIEPDLYRIASAIMKSESDCLDAAQEAVLKAYLSIQSLKQPEYFKTWITRILIRECTRLLKERNKVVPIQSLELKPKYKNDSREEKMDLHEGILTLEQDYRIVITLFYIQDLSVKEIASIIEQPEGTVKSRLSRARKKLEKWLTNDNQPGVMEYEKR